MIGRVLKFVCGGLFFCSMFQVCPAARAEVTKELSFSTGYDSNSFGNMNRQGESTTQLMGSLSWWLGGKDFETRIFYSGEGYLFARTGERTVAVNRVGASYARRLGAGRNRLYAGSSFDFRLGRLEYQVYDYAGLTNYVTVKWYVNPSVMLRTGYTMRLRNYRNLETSGFTDHYVFAQVSKFWPTRTTLRGDLSYGYKRHGSAEGQVVMGVQLAQSLAEHTGVSLRYQARLNTTADPLASGVDGYVFEDEDLFIDRYDYGGHEWSARLTQQLPGRMRAVLEGGYEVRNYQELTTQALLGLSADVDALRTDRNPFASVVFEKPLTERVEARFIYDFQRNRSSDFYFDYDGRHRLSLGFDVKF